MSLRERCAWPIPACPLEASANAGMLGYCPIHGAAAVLNNANAAHDHVGGYRVCLSCGNPYDELPNPHHNGERYTCEGGRQ